METEQKIKELEEQILCLQNQITTIVKEVGIFQKTVLDFVRDIRESYESDFNKKIGELLNVSAKS